MLKELTVGQARFIAILARTARQARDALLDNVPEEDFGEPAPARGEHNPTAALGLDPLPSDASAADMLRDAIAALSPAARSELYTLMRVGQGDLAARTWHRGLSEAARLGDETTTAALIEDPDLHDHIIKGLFEVAPSA